MVHVAVGHRRTGLCPTFAQPALQRDGYLLRVPLVGGRLDLDQVDCLTDVAVQAGNGIVELTNRGNLQLRGLQAQQLGTALDACRAVGLGDAGASLVTISPFASVAEHRLRDALVSTLQDVDIDRLSRKFVVHLDDVELTTADRPADMSIRLRIDRGCEVIVRALGTTTCGSTEEAAALAHRLAMRCIQLGPHARAADVAAEDGPAALGTHAWLPSKPARRFQPLPLGVTVRAGDDYLTLAAARFGRVSGTTLAGLGRLLRRHQLANLRVTPWRTFAFACTSAAQAAAVLADAASIGLLTDVGDPAVGVIACIGSAGCWQTELDTMAEAERFVANRPADIQSGALVHISGCDKFCAIRAPVTCTFVGRADNSGFDAR